MAALFRRLPGLLAALVLTLCLSVVAAPMAGAADAAGQWWDKNGDGQLSLADTNDQISTGIIIPPSMLWKRGPRPGGGGAVGPGLSALSKRGQLFLDSAVSTVGAGIALGAAWALSPARTGGRVPEAAAPTIGNLEDVEPNLLGGFPTGGNTIKLHNQEGGSVAATLARDCGWYRTVTGGSVDQLTNTGTITFVQALVGGDGAKWGGAPLVDQACEGFAAHYAEGAAHRSHSVGCWRASLGTFYMTSLEWVGYNVDGGGATASCPFGDLAFIDLSAGSRPDYDDPNASVNSKIFDGDIYVFPGMDAVVENYIKDNTRIGVEVTCKNEAGTTRTVTAYSATDSLNATVPACPSGYFPDSMRQWVDHPLSQAGDVNLGTIQIDPEAYGQYSGCLGPLALVCAMSVVVDGITCKEGQEDCVNCWDTATQSPERVKCSWGEYELPFAECISLMNAYKEGAGGRVVTDPNQPGYYPPAPTTGPTSTVPATNFPGAPVPGVPDPVYGEPLGCPRGSLTTSQLSGLQPVAVEGLKCIMGSYPDLSVSSGYRTGYVSADSDHPRGLAVDVTRPDWATESGRTRLWQVAGGIASRAGIWNVRYIIFDSKIYWPTRGWVPYTYSGPATGADAAHENHIHISFGPSTSPGSDPSLEPGPGENPYPRPGTGTGGEPAPGPGTGTGFPEPDGQNCDGSGITWSPVSWVVVPMKCLFVPSVDVPTKVAQAGTDFASTGLGSWLTAPVGAGEWVADQGKGDCHGPAWNVSLSAVGAGSKTLYPFSACSSPMSTLAAITRASLSVMFSVALVQGMIRLASAVLGLQATIERTGASGWFVMENTDTGERSWVKGKR